MGTVAGSLSTVRTLTGSRVTVGDVPDTPLAQRVAAAYSPEEYPALAHQISAWSVSRPLAGVTILDATPVFTNTLVKYWALQAAGAEVTVSAHRAIPGDLAVIAALPGYGIPVADEPTLRTTAFDVVSDCAGTHSDVASNFGYVELTRSGVPVYASCESPVFIADAGMIKRIETSLGTGDGFVRAMDLLGHRLPTDASVVVFGGGKVGSGVAAACSAQGAEVTVVDPTQTPLPPGVTRISPDEPEFVESALATAWCVVAATGRTAALAPWTDALLASGALLANMGATDEFGSTIPAEAVLHGKVAVNFALDEPTRLRYLDPTMALTNAGAVELRHGRVPPGPHLPTAAIEAELLGIITQHGIVASELPSLEPMAADDPEAPL